ncbi:uracil-DNA glycosylase [Pseudaestuariivita sp.]|uniref:uracil-DNA glycosylase n=1 Tax=Pseudaestuariivita sp. TaxID=2211669 RepID=UPI004058A66D
MAYVWGMEMDSHQALAALAWQIELGADEAIGDVPVARTAVPAPVKSDSVKPAPVRAATPEPTAVPAGGDPVADAERAAAAAGSLEALKAAVAAYPHCELQKGARSLVFSDGIPGAPVMLVGEAPGRDEDREGKPFVGRAGQLLDRILEAGGLSRQETVYLTNVLPWRPPQNRDPKPDEMAMMLPFLRRHIALAQPKVLVAVGNHACQALLGRKGITRLRGQWSEAEGLPCLPMLHPAYLLRNPAAKKQAWADMLDLAERVERG